MSLDAKVVPDKGDEATFTGERFLPQCSGEIAYEHWHRYAFVRALAAGKRVLDVACGEGYGAALLSTIASTVDAVDIDIETVRYASGKYAHCGNLRFAEASCTALPFPDRSFDIIVSFETIEHIDGSAQLRMLTEFDRLLERDGILILSSPNKAEYSGPHKTANEFHVKELYRDELARLLAQHFEATRWFGQRLQCWSGIWADRLTAAPIEALSISDLSVHPYGSPQAMYYVVLAARSEAALAVPIPRGSILTDDEDSVAKRHDAAVRQLIQHYKLVDELTVARDRHAQHVLHLERIARERDDVIESQEQHVRHLEQLVLDRNGSIEAQAAHVQHLEQLVVERERVIERQAVRVGELESAVEGQRIALETGQGYAEALRLEAQRLEGVGIENRKTIGALQERARHLSDVLRQTYSWRWWLQFPLRRARGDSPPE